MSCIYLLFYCSYYFCLIILLAPQCSNDQFKCDDLKCIPKEWFCDGESDCFDSSDEKQCSKLSI